jgi:hypothetical protein
MVRLAQMVAVMPSIGGDHSRIRAGRMWRWCRITLPPLWFTLNQNALRPCRSRLRLLTAAVRRAPCSRVSGNVLSGRLGGRQLSDYIQCVIASPASGGR